MAMSRWQAWPQFVTPRRAGETAGKKEGAESVECQKKSLRHAPVATGSLGENGRPAS
jgi:hypothetical protein